MKKLLLGFVVVGIGALGMWGFQVYQRTAPSISVALQDDTGGVGAVGVPAVDGYVSGGSGTAGNYSHTQSYKVVASPAGRLFVLAHYRVERSGQSKEFDLALPLWNKKPDLKAWSRLDSRLTACAYLDGDTIRY